MGQLVGVGTFAKVFQGFDEESGRLVAIKQLDFSQVTEDEREAQIEYIEKEVGILKNLKHPNIISYYGTKREDTCINIMLEFCICSSLTRRLDRQVARRL